MLCFGKEPARIVAFEIIPFYQHGCSYERTVVPR